MTMKTKLVVKPGIIVVRFDGKSFFNSILGFHHAWDYNHYSEYISQKTVNLSSTNKIHLKFDAVDGSEVDGSRQPILYTSVLDKPSGYKVFFEPEKIEFKKNKKICSEYYNFLFSRR